MSWAGEGLVQFVDLEMSAPVFFARFQHDVVHMGEFLAFQIDIFFLKEFYKLIQNTALTKILLVKAKRKQRYSPGTE